MKAISHSATIRLHSEPAVVFPLFTPLGEYHWVESWSPEFVYPDSGEAATGTIFRTQHASSAVNDAPHPADSIWVTVTYDPIQHVAVYISITPDVVVVRVDIHCQSTANNHTEAEVTYCLTALSDIGEESVSSMTTMRYQSMMADWEQAINHYLAHGTPIFQQ
jgi:hypothetical protein